MKDLDVILPLKREEEEESSDASVVRDNRFIIDTNLWALKIPGQSSFVLPVNVV
jgi:hypothetical protein